MPELKALAGEHILRGYYMLHKMENMRMPELKALAKEHILRGYYMLYKMENMRMPELKALAREHILRGYSRLRKAELIAFLQDNEHQALRRPHPNRPPLPLPQRHTVGPHGVPRSF